MLLREAFKVQSQALQKGDVMRDGSVIHSVSRGVRTPSGKVEVTHEHPKRGRRTSVWGSRTEISVDRPEKT